MAGAPRAVTIPGFNMIRSLATTFIFTSTSMATPAVASAPRTKPVGRAWSPSCFSRAARSSLIIKSDLAELLLIAHFYDASVQQCRRTIDTDVTFSMAHNRLGQAYLHRRPRPIWLVRTPHRAEEMTRCNS
jgi:hypothetical protein